MNGQNNGPILCSFKAILFCLEVRSPGIPKPKKCQYMEILGVFVNIWNDWRKLKHDALLLPFAIVAYKL